MIHQLFPRANVTQKWELYESSSAQYGDISRTKDAFAKHSQRVKEQLTAVDLNMFNEDGEDVSTPEVSSNVTRVPSAMLNLQPDRQYCGT